MLSDQREVQRDLTRLARQLHAFYNVDGTNMARGHFVSWTIANQHEAEKLAEERADLEEKRKMMDTALTQLFSETRSYQN